MNNDFIVFRQRAGKTFVANAPRETFKPSTPEQQQTRQRFQQAVIYGKTVNADLNTKANHEAVARLGRSAYNVILPNIFNAPDFSETDVSGYRGKPGDIIRLHVTDEFVVKTIQIKIDNGAKRLIEEGNATADPNGLDYIFTANKNNEFLAGDNITFSATNAPDNLSVKTPTLMKYPTDLRQMKALLTVFIHQSV